MMKSQAFMQGERTMDAKETMGRRIARLRIERGMTQENLAREMGVSAQAVSKWESGVSHN